ncbi:hypothetical protein NL676_005102 [Syzygium grande]|nr:hypothetical protein NL676_005102 [Syzygium grande]
MFDNKHISKVYMPIMDLTKQGQEVRFVSYQVNNSEIKPSRVWSFSYRVYERGETHDAMAIETTSSVIVGGYSIVNPPSHRGWHHYFFFE